MSNLQLAKNYIADVAIPAFRLVKPGTADDRVTLATASTDALIGTTTDIAAGIGERCDVQVAEISYVEAGAAIVRGAFITSDATGRAITAAPAAGVNASVAGRALETATAAGDVIRMMQSIGQIQG
ncbi:capsid cement protein [Undibacterium sp.]|uniref:capsid cement protein n=1 Tax=Undibacterium sp. TaxID=1914977 RepID=UPI0025D14FB1|nr:capsid cement protein [Undibacterium sp.]